MRESKLQTQCIGYLRAKGIPFVRIEKASDTGAPDLIVFCKYKTVCFELKKSAKAKRSKKQIEFGNSINEHCLTALHWFLWNYEIFCALIYASEWTTK